MLPPPPCAGYTTSIPSGSDGTVRVQYSRGAAVARLGLGAIEELYIERGCNHKSCRALEPHRLGLLQPITALRRCRRMAAEPAVAAGAASGANGGTEAKGDDAGVQSLRSSPLPPPFQQREPAASISPLARSSTGSPLERDVPLSQTVQPADSSTSKGATKPGRLARACSKQKLDISSVSSKRKPSGEDPEATFQVCANSIAARQLYKGLMAHMLLTLSLTLSLTLK